MVFKVSEVSDGKPARRPTNLCCPKPDSLQADSVAGLAPGSASGRGGLGVDRSDLDASADAHSDAGSPGSARTTVRNAGRSSRNAATVSRRNANDYSVCRKACWSGLRWPFTYTTTLPVCVVV